MEKNFKPIDRARLPLSLKVLGAVICFGTAMLAVRLIWEETVWTWERGPQMVGFSLAHGTGAVLFLFPLLLVIWLAVVIVLTMWNIVRKNPISHLRWVALALAIVILVVGALPEGFWERIFISQMAASPYADELFLYAAYRSDLGAVRGFISHGVPIDTANHSDWRTALHAAALNGDLPALRYLLSKGANINAVDRAGDSPLELATSRGHQEAATFLSEHGAKRLRGDESQREKARSDEVREEIERTNPGSTTWHR